MKHQLYVKALMPKTFCSYFLFVMKVMLQYYIERQCLLKCTCQIIMHTWKSIMQLDNPVVPIGGIETILVIKVSAESANQFGELVADPVTNELLHYTGKPDTFEQSLANVNNMMQMKTKHRCGSKSIPVRVYSSI
ncbi:uncharacterized protein LOC114282672 isoform X1 [Camellia sinensis]|uniref:uncharacterized protein LOC114282672 isoform X1 n=1 Tax=Camellia sinensis TaxID=4442 RepID=UPI001035A912|nr:uncharacterized protein LOC114282672 isoform X1 [Camellia sinensis]